MLAFLLAKPTQFDSPFFKWMYINRKDIPFVVFYWKPVGTSSENDSETGASVTWGFNLLEGYPWQQTDPKEPASFVMQLRQSGIRYLVCNGWKDGFAPLIAAAAKQGLRLGLRIDSVLWDKSPIEMRIRRIWLGRSYRPFSHFFSSGSLGDAYLRAMGYQQDKVRRWPYCVDVDFFAPKNEYSKQALVLTTKYGLDERPVVLSVCKWIERENPLELLKAFVQLYDKGMQLVMIGDGLLRDQMATLRNQYPELSIIFPGYVPYTELPAWYALSKVFVHSANCEVWGVSIHEAIAAGCAVIGSTRVGSGYDLIHHGQNGFQYPLGNVPALVQCIKDALTLAPETIERTNKTILQDWNYAAMVKAFEGLV